MMPKAATALLAALIAALIFAWGCQDAEGGSEGASDMDGDTDSDGDSDVDSDTDSDSDTGCDEVDFPVAGNPPDILILLDRSNSMNSGFPTYWSMVTEALIETTATMDNQIRFGLMIFPHGSVNCEPPPSMTTLVEIGDLNAAEIEAQINGQTPTGGGTPTTVSLERAAEYLNSIFDDSEKYILLATDGAPNCSEDMTLQCPECPTTQTDLVSCYNHNDCLDGVLAVDMAVEVHDDWGIDIYVIGVGGVVGVWDDVMNDIAAAGGTDAFFSAEDASQIQDALSEIAAAALQCTFSVDWEALAEGASTDQNKVNVFADGILVIYSEDCTNPYSWHWLDNETIELCEGLCDDYKTGEVSIVTASFGCDTVLE